MATAGVDFTGLVALMRGEELMRGAEPMPAAELTQELLVAARSAQAVRMAAGRADLRLPEADLAAAV
jgi:hypothetical protein